MLRTSSILVILLLATLPAPAQEAAAPPPPADTAKESRPAVASELTEEVDVNLVTVDFLVTDKDGAPVTDLRPEEVTIRDEGREVGLAFLERVDDRPAIPEGMAPPVSLSFDLGDARPQMRAPADRAPRWILFVLDRYNIAPDTRSRAVAAANRFLSENWRPGDRGAVAVYDTVFRFVLNFTTDPSLIRVALSDPNRYGPDPNFDRQREINDFMQVIDICGDRQDPYPCAYHHTRSYIRRRISEAEDFLQNMELASKVLGTVEGRKYLVLFSDGFSAHPVNEAMDAVEAVLGPATIRGMRIQLLEEVGGPIDAFTAAAGLNEVTLFSIDTRRRPAGMLSAAHSQPSNEFTPPVDPFVTELRDSRATLTELAEATGGRHYIGLDAAELLNEAMRAVEGLYTAGYYLRDLTGDDIRRKVKVKVDRPGVRVTYRKKYQRLVRTPPPLRADLSTGAPRRVSDDRYEIPVEFVLDPLSFPFQFAKGRALTQLTLHLALLDEMGRPATEGFHFLALEYPEEPFKARKIRPPRYQGVVGGPAGRYVLKIRAREPQGGGEIALEVPVNLGPEETAAEGAGEAESPAATDDSASGAP